MLDGMERRVMEACESFEKKRVASPRFFPVDVTQGRPQIDVNVLRGVIIDLKGPLEILAASHPMSPLRKPIDQVTKHLDRASNRLSVLAGTIM